MIFVTFCFESFEKWGKLNSLSNLTNHDREKPDNKGAKCPA